jgi:hypothetical protein
MQTTLSIGGWIFLILAWVFILGLNVFCFVKLLREKPEQIVDPLTNPEDDEKP